MIQQTIRAVVSGENLSTEEAAQTMDGIMKGEATPAQIGSFVTALHMKGETAEEVAGMVRAMRTRALRVSVDAPLVDTCGTGGDGSGTFNISTAAGLVVAGLGVKVAKHGNRAMSGASGSADVLEALGVKIDLGPEGVKRCLEEVGFGFMFAPIFHPSMKFAAGPRREIGIRSVFNILGPLTNPAGADSQLIGVASPSIGEMIAKVLCILGSSHALIVHGKDGLDEISLSDETQIWELKDGSISSFTITPQELDFTQVRRTDLKATTVKESAEAIRDVFQGSVGPMRNVVLANAAGALVVTGRAESIKRGIPIAAKSIDSGAALGKLEALIELSQRLE